MDDRQAKLQILKIIVRGYNDGLMAGTSGNLSCLTDDGNMAITPGSVDYSTMAENDIMIITLDGEILQGPHKPSSEWRMHAQVYKALPAVRAVFHTHSPYATSFAVLHKPIPVILSEMVPFIKGDVKVAPFALPGTDFVGTGCVPFLKERTACLMANHGVLAVGETLPQAYIRAVYVEDAAKIYHMALSVGTPVELGEDWQAKIRGDK